jgi:hypothetical protein
MPEEESRLVRMATDEDMQKAFDAYALAVGKVAHEWNMLNERLGQLFTVVVGARTPDVSLAVWNSSENDRAKQKMLKDAIQSYHAKQWPWDIPVARTDLIWLADQALNLGEDRNNAVHAPCMLAIDHTGPLMIAHVVSRHARASKLRGKPVLPEFEWVRLWASELAMFAQRTETGLGWPDRYPWPDRPQKPERPPKPSPGQLSPMKG